MDAINEREAEAIKRIEAIREAVQSVDPSIVRDKISQVLARYNGGAISIVVPLDSEATAFGNINGEKCTSGDFAAAIVRAEACLCDLKEMYYRMAQRDGNTRAQAIGALDLLRAAVLEGDSKTTARMLTRQTDPAPSHQSPPGGLDGGGGHPRTEA